jgi:hypothetical protein
MAALEDVVELCLLRLDVCQTGIEGAVAEERGERNEYTPCACIIKIK